MLSADTVIFLQGNGVFIKPGRKSALRAMQEARREENTVKIFRFCLFLLIMMFQNAGYSEIHSHDRVKHKSMPFLQTGQFWICPGGKPENHLYSLIYRRTPSRKGENGNVTVICASSAIRTGV
ncbi:hypothetical protein [Komagataeibacter xylinus]|uniref:Uncharacterized protein n=1 Tax=Komagataeibacter xylinus TaxID=28448 RepID=A0A857FR52_KOMXY|nr:hypothetical protein [Komagataeibacter xylinus]QHC36636.1 hypothetical protein FMA36_14985 [Komagataeibacter xylinus]